MGIPARPVALVILAGALGAAVHVVLFESVLWDPPILRAYGPDAAAWNAAALVLLHVGLAAGLGRRALWERRMALALAGDPYAGTALSAVALWAACCAALLAIQVPTTIPQEVLQQAIAAAAAIAGRLCFLWNPGGLRSSPGWIRS
jgi:hypothetical protein